jgi:hypothetical protein
MPGYIYAQDAGGAIYINLYVSTEASFKVNGGNLSLAMQSELPWGGKSTLAVTAEQPVRGALKLRIPGWARNQPAPATLYAYTDRSSKQVRVSLNGRALSALPDRFGYVTLDRIWKSGDSIEIEFPVEVRKVVADKRVKENRGRFAVERGPIVYCAEWPDCQVDHVLELMVDPRSELKTATDPALFGGTTVITAEARRLTDPTDAAKPIKLIPYHLWANRGEGEMTVWLAEREFAPGDTGPAGGFIFHVNPDYATDGWRYLEAAPFDQSAGAQWGCFRRSLTGARGTAIGTGKQNTADMLAACAEPASAAALCATLNLNGVTGWFLPSRDELVAMYRNLMASGVSDFGARGVVDNFTYWASSQNTADMAAHVDFADLGRVHGDDKDFPRRVRAVRAF